MTVEGTTVLVTGSTDGLGKAVAIELARQGATVLVHARNRDRAQEALSDIRSASGSDRLREYVADFVSLSQVQAFAELVASEEQRLDVLVNNAGIGTHDPGGGERALSTDGYERRFAVNYLAPFLLSRMLEPLLVRSAPARIVNVASLGQDPIDFDDVMLEHGYSGTRAYGQSKLSLIMLTFDQAARLSEHDVTANCLHPGTFMPTKMVLEAGRTPRDSLDTGIESTMRLIADPALDGVSGRFFDRLEEGRVDAQAYDEDARRRLRELSEELVGAAVSAS
jgi:NAD(P)-dependent dehydrogenase (short-subunit alcohol dehydrogenase family)